MEHDSFDKMNGFRWMENSLKKILKVLEFNDLNDTERVAEGRRICEAELFSLRKLKVYFMGKE